MVTIGSRRLAAASASTAASAPGPRGPAPEALPDRRIRVRIVERAPPDRERVAVLQPVPPRPEGAIRVGAAIAGDAGSATTLEGQRLHDLGAPAVTEPERSAVLRTGEGVAPEQQPLRAGRDAVRHAVTAALLHQVAVPVAREAARARAQRHEAVAVCHAGARSLRGTDVGLMVGQAEMLAPVLRRDVHRQAGGQRLLDHGPGDALRVQVDLERTTGVGHAGEDHLPEIVGALPHAALAVDAQGDAGDGGAGLEQSTDRGTAVRTVGLGREAGDGVVRLRAIEPLVAVHPDAELELQSARDRFLADEAQHLQVVGALRVGELRHAHVESGHGEQEGIGEQEIGVGDVAKEVVADAEAQVEAVEALGREVIQILGPHRAVVEPRLVLGLADEGAHDATDAMVMPPPDPCAWSTVGRSSVPVSASVAVAALRRKSRREKLGFMAAEKEPGDGVGRSWDGVGRGSPVPGELQERDTLAGERHPDHRRPPGGIDPPG